MKETLELFVERTPNPNALKFVTNMHIRFGDAASVTDSSQVEAALPKALIELDFITEVFLKDKFITITVSDPFQWIEFEETIKSTMINLLDDHNPYFTLQKKTKNIELSPDMQLIDDILDKTIRTGLNSDGGDLTLVHYEYNQLTVRYEGACHSCPSAATSTLMAIQQILREQFNPHITVMTE